MNVTVSIYRAAAGGYVGPGHVHPALLDAAREGLAESKEAGLVADGFVSRCGDGIGIVLLRGPQACEPPTSALALDIFGRATSAARRLHQHGVNGDRPDVEGAEIELMLRASEPVLCFYSDNASRGAWNVHLYRMFGDPFNTPSLVRAGTPSDGYAFVAEDARCSRVVYELPEDLYRFLAAVERGEIVVREVRRRTADELVAVASTGRDPVLVVRSETPFPAVDEVLEAFGAPASLLPVSVNGDATTRTFARAVGLGFQVAEHRLVGPRDLLADPAFDDVRRDVAFATERGKRLGPFASRFA